MREQRKSYWHSSTQEDLAEMTGLEVGQIARIEQGKMKKLRRFLEPLANAFQLNELQRAEFYAIAGYNYHPKTFDVELSELYSFVEQLHFPASIRNPVWDFIGFNVYHSIFWGYTPLTIEAMYKGIGANLLRVLFEKEIASHQTSKLEERDLENAIANFKTVSFRYITKERYDVIVRHMLGNNLSFKKAWDEVEKNPLDGKARNPLSKTIHHQKLGEIEFMSLHMPSRYVGDFFDVSISIEKYQGLYELAQEEIQRIGKRLHKFPIHDLA